MRNQRPLCIDVKKISSVQSFIKWKKGGIRGRKETQMGNFIGKWRGLVSHRRGWAPATSTPSSYCVQIITVKMVYSVLFSNTFITFKMAYSCCFRFGGNLDFPDFLQNKFYNIDYCSSGYGWWLMFGRSWVQIRILDDHLGFSHWFVVKIVLFVWKNWK